jgi:hypothetical protein
MEGRLAKEPHAGPHHRLPALRGCFARLAPTLAPEAEVGDTVPGIAGRHNDGWGPSGSQVEGDGGARRPHCHRGTRLLDQPGGRVVGFDDFVVLNLEVLEDLALNAVLHRRPEEVGHAKPAVEGLEVAPHAYEDDILRPVRVNLTADLGMDQPIMLADVPNNPLSVEAEGRDLSGIDPTHEDPDYQVPTP